MEGLKRQFAQCKEEKRPALVTYFTAGFPTVEETVDIMLGLQAGGAGQSRRLSGLVPGTNSTLNRCNRTRSTVYGSHRRWPNDPEVE